MADQQDRDTITPTTDGDIAPPPTGTTFQPEPSLGETASFTPESGDKGNGIAGAKQALLDNVAKGREQAGDKARLFAEDGKARATSALGQLSSMLTDAATQVDEKLGEQYGQYARQAADRVQGFSSAVDSKSVDDLVADVRELVKKSPAVAVGVAAGLGFVVARLLSSGLDQRPDQSDA
ncbi:hypothetical protein [Sphingomonas adhaesiva]|uniref:hypothetical protein n=1 Tax=Sphingomonas adhaesiva TaxID=28212 RepID=UPI002FF577B1